MVKRHFLHNISGARDSCPTHLWVVGQDLLSSRAPFATVEEHSSI